MAYGVAARMGLTRRKKRTAPLVAKVRRSKDQAYGIDWNSTSAKVIERDGHRCTKCGKTKNLQAHHIIPVSMGGRTVMSNMKTLCIACHKLQPHHQHLR